MIRLRALSERKESAISINEPIESMSTVLAMNASNKHPI